MTLHAVHHVSTCNCRATLSVEVHYRQLAVGPGGGGSVTDPTQPGYYLHFQPAAQTWIIPHMLGRYPNITLVDSLGREIEGDVTYLDPNTARADFAQAVGGSAFCI